MKNMSLRTKLLFGGILVLLIPLLVIGVYSVYKSSTALQNRTTEHMNDLARELANDVNDVIVDNVILARTLANNPVTVEAAEATQSGDAEADQAKIKRLSAFLTRTMTALGSSCEAVFVADLNGRPFADGSGGTYNKSVADRTYFQAALSGKVVADEAVQSRETNHPIVPICVPVQTADGRILGALTLLYNIADRQQDLNELKLGQTGYAFVVNKEGLTLMHPDPKVVLNLNFKQLPGMEKIAAAMTAGQTGHETYAYKGVEKAASFAPVPVNGWSLGVTMPVDEYMGASTDIRNGVFLVAGVFLVLTVLLILMFTNRITRPIIRAIGGMSESSTQVSSAASQLSGASQQLAEGTSEQAASLEETSSSLEEIASMSRQNADNAREANTLMDGSQTRVRNAEGAMDKLLHSMEGIKKASDETSRIIKTIDEIAFQTNLLALNAAVEAARAGEAGAGFAVVAEEVRNLAQRAAEAARQTSELIDGSVRRSGEGVEVAREVAEAVRSIATDAQQVAVLIGEINAASQEQSQGIDQVNTAMSQIDTVTQQAASNAEETASASEELNAQAEQMMHFVRDLSRIVGGDQDAQRNGAGQKLGVWRQRLGADRKITYGDPQTGLMPRTRPGQSIAAGKGGNGSGAPDRRRSAAAHRVVKPEEILPLNGDLEDF